MQRRDDLDAFEHLAPPTLVNFTPGAADLLAHICPLGTNEMGLEQALFAPLRSQQTADVSKLFHEYFPMNQDGGKILCDVVRDM